MLIATWNVNSILVRMPNVMRWLDDVKPDVLCMQETKCTDDKFPTLDFQARGYQCQLFGQQTYNGVAILTRDTCETPHRGYPGDDETAQSRLITTTSTASISLTSTFPTGRRSDRRSMRSSFRGWSGCASFLTRITIPLRRCCCVAISMSLPKSATYMTCGCGRAGSCSASRSAPRCSSIKDWGFTDAFRLHTETGGNFTWWDYRAGAFRRNLGLRIDHMWITEPLVSRSVRTWIDLAPRTWEKPSDHAPVIVEF